MAFADELVRAAEQAVIAEIGRNDGRRSAHWESRAAVAAVLRKLDDAMLLEALGLGAEEGKEAAL